MQEIANNGHDSGSRARCMLTLSAVSNIVIAAAVMGSFSCMHSSTRASQEAMPRYHNVAFRSLAQATASRNLNPVLYLSDFEFASFGTPGL